MKEDSQWEDLLVKIEEMLDSERYSWADDTLEGIHSWVRKNEYCTPGQVQAIQNIEDAGNR